MYHTKQKQYIMLLGNYTGLTFSGPCSTPWSVQFYVRGELQATFNVKGEKGNDIRNHYKKLIDKLTPLINKVK